MAYLCYSQRMLNPYRGVVNCIRYQSAEAVTTDGVTWDIYVSNDNLLVGLDTSRIVQTSDIRYGRWSLQAGLKRGPFYPSDDFKRMEQMGNKVYEILLQVHEHIPFPFRDNIEFWLLDTEGNPLALLNSGIDLDALKEPQALEWRAGLAWRRFFEAIAHRQEREITDTCPADALMKLVNDLAGPEPRGQWYERQEDGSGIPISVNNIETDMTRTLPASAFPPLLLNTLHHAADQQELVYTYLNWQAPWLLLLSSLDSITRRQLERAARQQALVVADQYRLYPEIILEDIISAARVEAMMRRSEPDQKEKEDIMSTFYIEMGVTGG